MASAWLSATRIPRLATCAPYWHGLPQNDLSGSRRLRVNALLRGARLPQGASRQEGCAGCPAACRPVVLEQAALVPLPSAVRADGTSRPSQQQYRRTRAHEEKQCQDNMAVLKGEFMRLQGQGIPQISHGNA